MEHSFKLAKKCTECEGCWSRLRCSKEVAEFRDPHADAWCAGVERGEGGGTHAGAAGVPERHQQAACGGAGQRLGRHLLHQVAAAQRRVRPRVIKPAFWM